MNLIDIVAILPYFITLATREDEKTLVQADLSEDKDTNKETIQTYKCLNLRKFQCLRKWIDEVKPDRPGDISASNLRRRVLT